MKKHKKVERIYKSRFHSFIAELDKNIAVEIINKKGISNTGFGTFFNKKFALANDSLMTVTMLNLKLFDYLRRNNQE